MVADHGHDAQAQHELSGNLRFQCQCLVRRDRNTSEERPKLVDLHDLILCQIIYSKRSISTGPPIEHIKSVLSIIPVYLRRRDKVYDIVLLAVLLYQLLVYNNCKLKKDDPRRGIKYLIGC